LRWFVDSLKGNCLHQTSDHETSASKKVSVAVVIFPSNYPTAMSKEQSDSLTLERLITGDANELQLSLAGSLTQIELRWKLQPCYKKRADKVVNCTEVLIYAVWKADYVINTAQAS
jgi:hypothetical protein